MEIKKRMVKAFHFKDLGNKLIFRMQFHKLMENDTSKNKISFPFDHSNKILYGVTLICSWQKNVTFLAHDGLQAILGKVLGHPEKITIELKMPTFALKLNAMK